MGGAVVRALMAPRTMIAVGVDSGQWTEDNGPGLTPPSGRCKLVYAIH